MALALRHHRPPPLRRRLPGGHDHRRRGGGRPRRCLRPASDWAGWRMRPAPASWNAGATGAAYRRRPASARPCRGRRRRWDEMRLDLGLDGGRGGRVRLAANTAALATIVAVHLPGFLAAPIPALRWREVLELASERVLGGRCRRHGRSRHRPRLRHGRPGHRAAAARVRPARRGAAAAASAGASPPRRSGRAGGQPVRRPAGRQPAAALPRSPCRGRRVLPGRARAPRRSRGAVLVEQGVGAAVLPRALVRARPRRLSRTAAGRRLADRRLTLCRPRNRTLPGGVRRLADHLLAGDAPAE